ncbi:MAG: hypothetical protein Q8O88_00545 [bacterium]|nr:hypothetical protein [bacterium]
MTPENSHSKFKIGEPTQPVDTTNQSSNRMTMENRSTPYGVVKLPDPIPGTEYGSQRGKWEEQRKLGNISESILEVTNPVGLQKSSDGKDNRDDFDLERLLAMGGRGATNITAEFGSALKNLEDGTDPEKMEKVKVLYTEMVNESMSAIFDLYDKNVKSDEKNAYPYDYRQAEFMQQNIKQAVTSLERLTEVKKSPESQVFIAELKQDLMWLDSFLHTTVAQSASLPYKFDIVMQMQLLKEGRYCAFVTNDDMEALMSDELPVTKLTNEQEKLKVDKKIGIAIPEEYVNNIDENGDIKEGKPLVEGPTSLREMAIKMYAASFKLRMNLAATSQADFASDKPETTTFKGQNLSKHELQFYKDLFWRWKDDPDPEKREGQFLTPYVTSKGDFTRDYTTLLEAAIIKNAHFRLKEIVGSVDNDATKTLKIGNLTKEVKAEGLSRMSSWRTRQDKDMVSMLATVITQQGLLQDFAYGHSYNYCYEYQWNTDGSGNPTTKKDVDMGGIYSMSGDFPSLGFARRKHVYDGMGNSCTKFLLPTSSHGRAEASMLSPFEMPGYTSFVMELQADGTKKEKELDMPIEIQNSDDEFLKEQWKFLFSNEKKYVDERKAMGYESLHPDIARQLKKWAFKWKTPWTSDNLGEDKKYEIEVPHLMPPALGNIANFWDSITLDKKLNFGGKSIFQELIEGKETYEIDWKKCETQAQSRWKVDLDMASRYMRVLIEPVDAEKDPILGLFHAGPSTFALKELAKRLRLSMRDSDEAPSTAHEIALIPFMVVMACAEKHGIGGAYAWDATTKEDMDNLTSNADRFFNEMAYWKRALKWLPGDRAEKDKFNKKDKDGNLIEPELKYGNEMALIAEFYEATISRVMKSSSEESWKLARKNLINTAARLNKFGHLNNDSNHFKFKVNPTESLEK